MITLAVITIYIYMFIYACYKNQQFDWLWGSIILWIGFSFIGAEVLPTVLGITHIASIYQPYFYAFFASLFFFVNHFKWHKTQKVFFVDPRVGAFLAYFAITGLILHLALLTTTCINYFNYPKGLSFFTFWSLIQMYLLYPVYWIMAHLSLTFLMTLIHHQTNKTLIAVSWDQLLTIFLIALCYMLAYIFYDLLKYIFYYLFRYIINYQSMILDVYGLI